MRSAPASRQPAQIEFAQLCALKKLPAAAARFSRDAFAADPKRAENVLSGERYNAACAAALAGCGAGNDAGKLDDKERALWRTQARDWLRLDLQGWSKTFEKDNAKSRAAVVQQMRHWQTDEDLAGVRDKAALARLPEDERTQWQKLWSDVDVLLKRAEGKKEAGCKET